VKPETDAFLGKAREALAKADGMLDRWPDEAGREAYLAGLHAAQALIVESTGTLVKSHKGVQRELGRLTKDDPRMDTELRAFLGRTYISRPLPIMKPARGRRCHPNRRPTRLRQASALSRRW
jgi:uncharacterized protein (UPF0332 family)